MTDGAKALLEKFKASGQLIIVKRSDLGAGYAGWIANVGTDQVDGLDAYQTYQHANELVAGGYLTPAEDDYSATYYPRKV